MLQQTQVPTVLPYYAKWFPRFPTFPALARASESQVLHAWQGLGYYARARNLHATAKLVLDRHRGVFPTSITEIQRLPGIGKYTAHAVATFAFDQPVPIVEVNTARVLTRLFDLRIPIDSTRGRNELWNHAAALVPEKNSDIYNSALLDLGALVCLRRHPKCDICPVKKFCRAKDPESLPIKRARPATRKLIEKHVLIARDNKILLSKASTRWRGMWTLPPLQLNRLKRSRFGRPIHTSVFPFTNHRITLEIFRGGKRRIDNRHQRWFLERELKFIPIPSPHRRALMALLH